MESMATAAQVAEINFDPPGGQSEDAMRESSRWSSRTAVSRSSPCGFPMSSRSDRVGLENSMSDPSVLWAPREGRICTLLRRVWAVTESPYQLKLMLTKMARSYSRAKTQLARLRHAELC